MQISYQGRSVLIMPPGRKLQGATPALPPGSRLAALIIPGDLARDPQPLGPQPEILVVYGSSRGSPRPDVRLQGARGYHTGEGAVSLQISDTGVAARQWGPPDKGLGIRQ